MGLWLKQDDGSLVEVSGGGGGGTGEDGKGWTGGTYDPETGTVTFTSDDGLEFTTGDLRGTDGIDGLDGNMWHVGSGDPDPTLGADGDYYLDGTDGWVWIKRSSGWTNLYVNLTGPPGADGDGGGSHDHDYLPLSGGTVTGDLQVDGQIKAQNGSEAKPAISFTNQTDMGMWRRNATDLAFSVSGHRVLGAAMTSGYEGVYAFENLYAQKDLKVDGLIKAKGNAGQTTPSYGFTGDTEGLGLYGSPSSQWLRLTAGGVFRLQVAADKVLVKPDLQVNGDLVSTTDLYVNANGANYRFTQNYLTSFPNTGGARLRADAAGGASSPAFSFYGDPDTGMYRKTTNKLGFSAGGKEIAYVASDGIHLANYNSSGNFYRVDGNKGGWYNANHKTGMWVGGNSDWVTNYGNNFGIGSTTGMFGGLQATTGTGGFQYIMRSTTLSSFSYYTSSSVYKDRITTQSVSDDFDKLRPVTFIEAAPRGRSETEEARAWRLKAKEFGFIAEEIAELYDGHLGQYEAVDGKLKPVGFSWPGLISVTVKEVQDLRKRVAENEATIASLVERIEALEGNK